AIRVRVNRQWYSATVEPRLTLADFLRDELELTGTHLGCEHGICGACTILVDGAAVRSCLLFAVQADERDIVTVEGLSAGAELHPIQQAFWDSHALQCGFCTPGFLMTAVELLRENPSPSRPQIREAISGNLCRCTGYVNIIDAVERAASVMAVRDR